MDDLNLNDNLPVLEDNEDFDAAEALLTRWSNKDAEKPSDAQDPDEDANAADKETDGDDGDKEQDEASEDDKDEKDPQDADSDEDDDEKNEGDEGEADKTFADDTAFVKVKVDGAEHEVSIKDLTRLWGQEASLTRKSQEVASQTKVVTERRTQYETALNTMYQKAVERAKPYAQLDMALAAKNLSPEDYAALKADKLAAESDVKFFEQELKGHIEKVSAEAQEAHKKAADAAVDALTTKESPHYIEGWNDKVYHDLISYGVKMGIPEEQMLSSTSAPSFKILWMAQQYEKGKAVATQKKTKVVGKKPITGKGPKTRDSDRSSQAMARLQKTGSIEDAALTLFEKWGVE